MSNCRHYWLLGSVIPGQPNNQATCKLCGATREFKEPFIDRGYNWHPDSMPQGEQAAIHYLMDSMRREV